MINKNLTIGIIFLFILIVCIGAVSANSGSDLNSDDTTYLQTNNVSEIKNTDIAISQSNQIESNINEDRSLGLSVSGYYTYSLLNKTAKFNDTSKIYINQTKLKDGTYVIKSGEITLRSKNNSSCVITRNLTAYVTSSVLRSGSSEISGFILVNKDIPVGVYSWTLNLKGYSHGSSYTFTFVGSTNLNIKNVSITESDVLINKECNSSEDINYESEVINRIVYEKITYKDQYINTFNHTVYYDGKYHHSYLAKNNSYEYRIEKNEIGTINPRIISGSSYNYKNGDYVTIYPGASATGLIGTITYYYDNKHYKKFTSKSSFNGWYIPVDKFTTLGKHKIIISSYGKTVTKYITIIKANYGIDAPSITVKYKNSNYFKITITNKYSVVPIKSKKISLKVYTGKKYKTYNLKTNSKGVVYLNTKSLSLGTHKVIISVPKTSYYNGASKTSYIYVKKYIPQTTTYTHRSDSYLDGYYEDYDFDSDIHYQAWFKEYADPYCMIDVEVDNNRNVVLDSVTLVYKYNGNTYTKKVTTYSNFATYCYLPSTMSYLKTTIKWHYK